MSLSFIANTICLSLKALPFHGDFTSPGKSHKSNRDSYDVAVSKVKVKSKKNKYINECSVDLLIPLLI